VYQMNDYIGIHNLSGPWIFLFWIIYVAGLIMLCDLGLIPYDSKTKK
jgi:hypothetical protein